MLRRSDRWNSQIYEDDSVPKGILLGGMIVCALFVLGGYLLFVNTRWGQMIDNSAYAGRKIISPALIEYDHLILSAVSVTTLVVAIVLILVVGALRRCLTAAAIIAVGFAGAVAGGELLKHRLPRHALVPNDTQLPLDLQRQTYPSGHTTIGTSLAIALILISSTRWRPWMSVMAGFLSASFATGVLFVGWHRPSDALGGIFWSGFFMSLAALPVIALRGKPIRGVQPAAGTLSSILLVIVAAMAIPLWFTTMKIDDTQLTTQIPFLILSLLIMMSSFAVALWFGWQLRCIDLVKHT
jgi:PAP2 superfamily